MVTPSRLLDLLSHLRANHKTAADEVARIEADIKAVERTVALCGSWETVSPEVGQPTTPPRYDAQDYADMSQLEAIVLLAQRNNGVVRVVDAKRMLVETKKTQGKKPYSIATSIIIRSGRFEWVSSGTWRLISKPKPHNNGHMPEQQQLISIT